MINQMVAIQGHDTYERLPDISAPTLVVTGKEDGLVPPENSVTLAQRIPNADLTILSNASHLFNIELAQTTVDVVMEFISAGTPGSSRSCPKLLPDKEEGRPTGRPSYDGKV